MDESGRQPRAELSERRCGPTVGLGGPRHNWLVGRQPRGIGGAMSRFKAGEDEHWQATAAHKTPRRLGHLRLQPGGTARLGEWLRWRTQALLNSEYRVTRSLGIGQLLS